MSSRPHATRLVELEQLAGRYESAMLTGMVVFARGAVLLAEADAHGALAALRRATDAWQQLEAPYELARTRELVGLACRALDDDDAAALELDAARAAFEQLGARPDLERVLAHVAPVPGSSATRLVTISILSSTGRSNTSGKIKVSATFYSVAAIPFSSMTRSSNFF